MTESSKLGLYVHLPYCLSRCGFCDFNAHVPKGSLESARSDYLAALFADLGGEARALKEEGEARALESVYFGGGTPSLFTPSEIGAIMDKILSLFPLKANAEVSLEANPEQHLSFSGFKEAGVNRLSLGAQSFQGSILEALERSSESVSRASLESALSAGFERLNVDIIFGVTAPSLSDSLKDLRYLMAHDLSHVSFYPLTLEPHSLWYQKRPMPDEGEVEAIREAGEALMAASGLSRYELSAYAKPGQECVHNLLYWRFEDYFGVGAGAHGKLTSPSGTRRTRKPQHPQDYLREFGSGGSGDVRRLCTIVPEGEVDFERLLMGLRLKEGVGLPALSGETRARLQSFVDSGLLVLEGGRVRASRRGFDRLNEVWEGLLPENPA